MIGAVMLTHLNIPRLLRALSWPFQSQAERTVGRKEPYVLRKLYPTSLRELLDPLYSHVLLNQLQRKKVRRV